MNIKKMIKNIRDINGYTGSAVLDKTGEIIYIDENNKSIDFAFSSSLFNDTFKALNEASLDVGFSNLIRLEIETEEKMIFLLYRNKTYTVFTIFNAEGNISLAKMMINKSLKKDE